EGALVAKLRNAGQACTSANRFYVEHSVAAEFGQRLATRMAGLRVGPGLEEGVEIGPLINGEALDKVSELVAGALSQGARPLIGGSRPVGTGFFYPPTVLDRVPETARVAQEETFGPVVPILRFETDDEAIRIANATPYGLQAAVYTNDLNRAFRLAKRIRAGGVHLNDPTNLRWDALPFGGVKESGIGREGLRDAMQEMTDVKLISVNFG
ncbi:MAG: aldehyde dehydrogenase family protein, partial [Thermoplasmata archaeon]|nr:aldehyde dehydrogenase family protein [Thermoplasmata archaeon]